MYPKSNGKSEKTVQIAKNLLKKAKDQQQDPYLALLHFRNTPIPGMSASPIQMLMQRRTKTNLPTAKDLLKPEIVQDVTKNLKKKGIHQKKYYDKNAKCLALLTSGDDVMLQLPNKTWEPAKVVKQTKFPRSYIVEHKGVLYRRNRSVLRTYQVTDKTNI